jgi:Cu/Ag efflux pump CusA
MVGGMVTTTVLTLIVIPVIYALWKEQGLKMLPVTQSDKEE